MLKLASPGRPSSWRADQTRPSSTTGGGAPPPHTQRPRVAGAPVSPAAASPRPPPPVPPPRAHALAGAPPGNPQVGQDFGQLGPGQPASDPVGLPGVESGPGAERGQRRPDHDASPPPHHGPPRRPIRARDTHPR